MVEQFKHDEPEFDEPEEETPEVEHEPTPSILPVLPLRGTVVFPLTLVPLAAGQPRSLRLIDEVVSGNRMVALVLQKDATQEARAGRDYEIGAAANIHQMMRVPDGTVRLAVQGLGAIRIVEWIGEEPYLTARVEESLRGSRIGRGQALMRNTLELFERLVAVASNLPDELVTAALNIDDPIHLVYLVARTCAWSRKSGRCCSNSIECKAKLQKRAPS